MSEAHKSKNHRVLDLYVRLCAGKTIVKQEEATRYSVNERSIQRDINDIRAYLCNQQAETSTDQRSLVYDRKKKGFVMKGQEASFLTNSEILAVIKILLGSRAFTRIEMFPLLDKLIAGCASLNDKKLVTDLISNERFHYVELSHKTPLNDRLWDFGTAIKDCRFVRLTYQEIGCQDVMQFVIKPVAILFSEFYFYLVAYVAHEQADSEKIVPMYNNPEIYRVDCVKNVEILSEKFSIPYSKRFKDGEFRKRAQHLCGGHVMKIQLRYTGHAVETLLDQLPFAKILRQDENGYILDVEVFEEGVAMWLLGFGEQVEVLKPATLRKKMRWNIEKMLALYPEQERSDYLSSEEYESRYAISG